MLFECGTPKQCELFALVYVGDARELWENNWPEIFAREVRHAKSEAEKVTAHNNALILVEETLEHFRMNARTYMLDYMVSDTATRSTVAIAVTPKEIEQETNYDVGTGKQLHDEMGNLNDEQQTMYDDVVHCVESNSPQRVDVLYVDGPAGTGKTFLYTKLARYFRYKEQIVLIVAASGIAALLLPGGRTAHSWFRLPVPLPLEGAAANVATNNATAELLRKPHCSFETRRRMLCAQRWTQSTVVFKDVLQGQRNRNPKQPFGGMPIMLGGDVRQIPPVLRRVDVHARLHAQSLRLVVCNAQFETQQVNSEQTSRGGP